MTATPGDGKRGLFIHGGALGDFVLSLRILAAMRTVAPHVSLMTRCSLAPTLVGTLGIDHADDIETAGIHRLFTDTAPIAEIKSDRRFQHDLVVNTLTGSRLSENLSLLGIKTVIDLDPRPIEDDTRHITDQWLTKLASSGFPAETPMPILSADRIILRHAAKTLKRNAVDPTRPTGLINPGSGGRRKCWPHMLELARRIRGENLNLTCLMGPVESETMPEDERWEWAQLLPIISSPMDALAPLLSAADFVVGNDSGVSHLAAAVGTHTLTVFGPTNPRVWRPLGPRASFIAPPLGAAWPEVDFVMEALLAQIK